MPRVIGFLLRKLTARLLISFLLLSFVPLVVVTYVGWVKIMPVALLVEVEEEEAFALLMRMRSYMVMVSVAVAVLAAAVGVLLARQITTPLSRLADYARRVGRGEYSAELEIKGQDEVASVASDIKAMVKQILQMQQRLVSSERLATLGQVSGSISHELRNALGVIGSSVYYLKARLSDADERVREHLDRIQASVDGTSTIIQSLLDLTRMREPGLSALELVAVITDAITSAEVPPGVKLIWDFPKQAVRVSADREQLITAFRNIIINALEAMRGEGILRIVIAAKEGEAEVSFADTDPGITPENQRKLFQPFFTTKPRGIGFGLFLVRMIVERHSGKIEVKSEPGKGAIFIIQLPLYQEKAKEV